MDNDIYTDILGREIKVGDIVARAIYSYHTFHKVLKINKKGVVLSRGSTRIEYSSPEYIFSQTENRYIMTGRRSTHQYFVLGGADSIEGVQAHDMSINISKSRLSLILVC